MRFCHIIGERPDRKPGAMSLLESPLRGHEDRGNSAELDPIRETTQRPERQSAAFDAGWLLNRLSWHLQKVLFNLSADKPGVEDVLNSLEGVSYAFVDQPPNLLKDAITDVRRIYETQLCGEAASDAVASLVNPAPSGGYQPGEEPRQDLFDTWVYPLLRPVRECIWGKLTVTERWTLELGTCLDQGLHNSGLYHSIEAVRYVRYGYYASDRDESASSWGASGVETRSSQPGELLVDTAWSHRMRALLAKAGMPAASFETTLSKWEQADPDDQRNSTPRTIELLGRSIREHLADEDESRTGATAHSTDFRSVQWFGAEYSFTAAQAPVVKCLWGNWQQGTPDVAEDTLLLAIDPQGPPARLRDVFRYSSAWKSLIVRGGSKGTYRLAEPA